MEVSVEEESKSITEIKEEDIAELNQEDPNENLNLENLESLKVDRKPNIYQTDQAYQFQEDKERIDVFIKNYLMKFNMEKSLKVFEQEFYERLSKNEISLDKIGTVPEVYIKSEQIQKQIGNFQKDLDAAKIYSEKANSKFLKLRKAKESEKIRHRRVQQEKQQHIKKIDEMKKIYKEKENAITELNETKDNKDYLNINRMLKNKSNKIQLPKIVESKSTRNGLTIDNQYTRNNQIKIYIMKPNKSFDINRKNANITNNSNSTLEQNSKDNISGLNKKLVELFGYNHKYSNPKNPPMIKFISRLNNLKKILRKKKF